MVGPGAQRSCFVKSKLIGNHPGLRVKDFENCRYIFFFRLSFVSEKFEYVHLRAPLPAARQRDQKVMRVGACLVTDAGGEGVRSLH